MGGKGHNGENKFGENENNVPEIFFFKEYALTLQSECVL